MLSKKELFNTSGKTATKSNNINVKDTIENIAKSSISNTSKAMNAVLNAPNNIAKTATKAVAKTVAPTVSKPKTSAQNTTKAPNTVYGPVPNPTYNYKTHIILPNSYSNITNLKDRIETSNLPKAIIDNKAKLSVTTNANERGKLIDKINKLEDEEEKRKKRKEQEKKNSLSNKLVNKYKNDAISFGIDLLGNEVESIKNDDNKSNAKIITDTVKDNIKNKATKENKAMSFTVGAFTEAAKPLKVLTENIKEDRLARNRILDEAGITNPIQRGFYKSVDTINDITSDSINTVLNIPNNIFGTNLKIDDKNIINQDIYRNRTEREVANYVNELQKHAIKVRGGNPDSIYSKGGQLYGDIIAFLSGTLLTGGSTIGGLTTSGIASGYGKEGTTEGAITGGAKGYITGQVFKWASPVLDKISDKLLYATKLDSSVAMQSLSEIIQSGLKFGGGNAVAQISDLMKLDPNERYINWTEINKDIKSGKIKTKKDLSNAIAWNIFYNRASEVGSSAVTGMIYDFIGQATSGFNRANYKANMSKELSNEINTQIDSKKLEEDYKKLGLDKNATFEEAKAKYKQLAKKYHPDIFKETETIMKEINAAYDEILSANGWGAYSPSQVTPTDINTDVNSTANIVNMQNGVVSNVTPNNVVNSNIGLGISNAQNNIAPINEKVQNNLTSQRNINSDVGNVKNILSFTTDKIKELIKQVGRKEATKIIKNAYKKKYKEAIVKNKEINDIVIGSNGIKNTFGHKVYDDKMAVLDDLSEILADATVKNMDNDTKGRDNTWVYLKNDVNIDGIIKEFVADIKKQRNGTHNFYNHNVNKKIEDTSVQTGDENILPDPERNISSNNIIPQENNNMQVPNLISDNNLTSKKTQNYETKKKNTFITKLADELQVSKYANKSLLNDTVAELTEDIRKGNLT